jgi:hypothetical protein
MEANKIIVKNNEIKEISYTAVNKDDPQMAALQARIHSVWDNVFISRAGFRLFIKEAYYDVSDPNIVTIADWYLDDDGVIIHNILDMYSFPDNLDDSLSSERADREFHNKTQTIEIEYSAPTVPSTLTIPETIALRRITQDFDADYIDKNRKNVYIIGTLEDVNTLVTSLNADLSATVPSGYVLSVTDSFKLVFDSEENLIECELSPQDSFPYVDQNLPASIYHNLLLDKNNIFWTFNLTNNTRYFEIAYTMGSAYPVEPLGKNLLLLMITEEYDANFENTGVQNVYIQGRLSDVYNWAKSLNSSIDLPIPDNLNEPDKIMFEDDGVLAIQESEFMANDDMDYILFEDDSKMIIREHELIEDKDYFKFTFNSDDELVDVRLFGHIQRQMVRSKKVRREFSIEHSLRYSDAITNLSVTETLIPDSRCRIVQPKYDIEGYRYADD